MGSTGSPYPLFDNHATVKPEDIHEIYVPPMNSVEVFEKSGKPLKFHQRINLEHKRRKLR